MTPDDVATLRTDLLEYSRYIFKQRRGMDLLHADHHKIVCDALEKVFIGDIKRLIINIPPRSGKTELAVKDFISCVIRQGASDSERIGDAKHHAA